jgi:hypothetical protein
MLNKRPAFLSVLAIGILGCLSCDGGPGNGQGAPLADASADPGIDGAAGQALTCSGQLCPQSLEIVSGQHRVRLLTSDDERLYWASSGGSDALGNVRKGTIQSVSLAGGSPELVVAAVDASALMVKGSHVYWREGYGNTLWRAPKDGTGQKVLTYTALGDLVTGTQAFAITQDTLITLDNQQGTSEIVTMDLDGSNESRADLGHPNAVGIVTDGGTAYVTDLETGVILHVNLPDLTTEVLSQTPGDTWEGIRLAGDQALLISGHPNSPVWSLGLHSLERLLVFNTESDNTTSDVEPYGDQFFVSYSTSPGGAGLSRAPLSPDIPEELLAFNDFITDIHIAGSYLYVSIQGSKAELTSVIWQVPIGQ